MNFNAADDFEDYNSHADALVDMNEKIIQALDMPLLLGLL
jgi:hypothetical protein